MAKKLSKKREKNRIMVATDFFSKQEDVRRYMHVIHDEKNYVLNFFKFGFSKVDFTIKRAN